MSKVSVKLIGLRHRIETPEGSIILGVLQQPNGCPALVVQSPVREGDKVVRKEYHHLAQIRAGDELDSTDVVYVGSYRDHRNCEDVFVYEEG